MTQGSQDRRPRILTGRFRGRGLRVPRGQVTRPARARVRRSLFDILQAEVPGTQWLDLFAGSGSLGIEALSRGANHATFVEAGRPGLQCLKANLQELSLCPPEAVILSRRIPELFFATPPAGAPFQFASMDPPFAISRSSAQLQALCEGLSAGIDAGWWTDDALLVWEEPEPSPDPVPRGFREEDRRLFGTSRLRFLRVAPV